MNKYIVGNFLIISFLQFLNVNAQTNPSIPFYDVKINIDGKFDEAVWKNLPENTNFYNYYPDNGTKASSQTIVKIFHNGKNLYISAVYNDITSKIQIASLKRDGFYGGGDAFSVIIDPFNKQQIGYYFASNIGGSQTDALIEPIDNAFLINKNWNAVWKSKVLVNGKQKQYEYEIPLKTLGYTKDNSIFAIQFYLKNIKLNEWTIFKPVGSEFRLFDLRFNTPFKVENLTEIKTNKFIITPSITLNYLNNTVNDINETNFKPSLDLQYNVNSSLKLDATINPDFSQIEVDRQVTNLTRFAVNFPEKRNFFLENSDLFSNLGVQGVNPFYTRKIGALSEIQVGLKLSGNVAPNTRIGILDVQTEKNNTNSNQNYGAFVIKQKISNLFTSTAFLLNRQSSITYNRVAGINLNYQSKNKKWTGLVNYGKSFTSDLSSENNFYNAGIWYDTKEAMINASIKRVEKNYLTDMGFTPRLSNYDAINNSVIREEFTQANASIELSMYPKKSKIIYRYRYLFLDTDAYFDDEGELSQFTTFFNNALYFKNSSSVYVNVYQDFVNLKYAFNPLRNGNFILPDTYNFLSSQIGYNSIPTKKVYYNIAFRHGNYYHGKRTRYYTRLGYHLLPFANLETSYEINKIDLNETGEKAFHLARFTNEIFFNNRLNWTTYLQYNTQFDNFNVNSRIQWEYKPLSYIYLVITDNFTKEIQQKNWGIAFKANYRFDF